MSRKELRRLIKLGWTLQRLGTEFGVSRQRVDQVIKKDEDLKLVWETALAKRKDIYIDRVLLEKYIKEGYGVTGIGYMLKMDPEKVRYSIKHHNLFKLIKETRRTRTTFVQKLPMQLIKLYPKEELESKSKEELDHLVQCWRLWRQKVALCKSQKIDFNVPFKSIKFPLECPILGTPLDYTKGRKPSKYVPSFDKVIPCIGYTPGNVKVISQRANFLKNESSLGDIIKIYQYMKKYQKRFYFNPKLRKLRKNAVKSRA